MCFFKAVDQQKSKEKKRNPSYSAANVIQRRGEGKKTCQRGYIAHMVDEHRRDGEDLQSKNTHVR